MRGQDLLEKIEGIDPAYVEAAAFWRQPGTAAWRRT